MGWIGEWGREGVGVQMGRWEEEKQKTGHHVSVTPAIHLSWQALLTKPLA